MQHMKLHIYFFKFQNYEEVFHFFT